MNVTLVSLCSLETILDLYRTLIITNRNPMCTLTLGDKHATKELDVNVPATAEGDVWTCMRLCVYASIDVARFTANNNRSFRLHAG